MIARPWVFCSGQIGIDPVSNQMVTASVEEQTRQVLLNLSSVLEQAGSQLSQVVKTTVFVTDLKVFEKVNQVYRQFFKPPYPARSTIQVAALPLGAQVEIEAIAVC